MRQIQCVQCGRPLLAGEATAVVCPSCGHAAIVPAETLSAALSPSDDSATRPVPPEVVAAATAAGAAPAAPAPPEQPTLPPPPPADARTMPAYDPPSLPRSRVAGNAGAPDALNAPAPPPAGAMPSAPALSHSPAHPAQDVTRDLSPELLARAAADPATRPVSGAPPLDEAVVAAARRRRERLTALSGVALLIVLAIGSAGAIMAANGTLASLLNIGRPLPTATAVLATPTSAVPAGYKPYTAQDGSYQLDVPVAWVPTQQAGQTGDLSLFLDPATGATYEVESVQAALDPKTADDQFLTRLGNLIAGTTGTVTTGGATTDTYLAANISWTRETENFAITAGGQTTNLHVVVLAAQHGQRTFLVAYFAPSAEFSTADGTYFQPMLQTLKLA